MGAAIGVALAGVVASIVDAAGAAGLIDVGTTIAVESIETTIADGVLETAFSGEYIELTDFSASAAIAEGASYGINSVSYVIGGTIVGASLVTGGIAGIAAAIRNSINITDFSPEGVISDQGLYEDIPISAFYDPCPIYDVNNPKCRGLLPFKSTRLRRLQSRKGSKRRLRSANSGNRVRRKRRNILHPKKIPAIRRKVDVKKRPLRRSNRKR